MALAFPTQLDDPQFLLRVVGSYWADTYAGNDLVAALLNSVAQSHAAIRSRFEQLLLSVSRFTVPVYRRQRWLMLPLRESERRTAQSVHWDGSREFNDGLAYDETAPASAYGWPVSANLAGLSAVFDGIFVPAVGYAVGVDCWIEDSYLWFREDPFVRLLGELADGADLRELTLCGFEARFDDRTTERQFGYVVRASARSSEAFRGAVNAVWDSLVEGTTRRSLRDLLAATTGAAFAIGDETVEAIFDDALAVHVLTDRQVYTFEPGASLLVAVGDRLQAGQAVSRGAQLLSLNRGLPDELDSLTLGRGLLPHGLGDLTFVAREVDLTVVRESPLEVEFALEGAAADVRAFWAWVRAREAELGQTLASRLDTRAPSARTADQPLSALPATINPAKFVAENVLRSNVVIAALSLDSFGLNPAGLPLLGPQLDRIIPPAGLCLVSVRYVARGDLAIMDGPGDSARPGYTETAEPLGLVEAADALAADTAITERVRAYYTEEICR